MASTVEKHVARIVTLLKAVTEQQESVLGDVSPDGRDCIVIKVW